MSAAEHPCSQCRAMYDALFSLYNIIAIMQFEPDRGSRPLLKDGVVDQHMLVARLLMAKFEAIKT